MDTTVLLDILCGQRDKLDLLRARCFRKSRYSKTSCRDIGELCGNSSQYNLQCITAIR